MLHIAERLHLWDSQRPFPPWRNRLVIHLCRDFLRKETRRARHEQVAAQGLEERAASHPERAMEAREELEAALAWLAPREREAFVLVDLEGYTAGEAAGQMGVSPSTVRAALTFARRKAREHLAQRENSGGVS